MLKPTLFMPFLSFDPGEQASDFELNSVEGQINLGYDSDFHFLVFCSFGAAPHTRTCFRMRPVRWEAAWLLADFLSCCWAPIWLSPSGFALICCPAFGMSFIQ